MSVCVCLWLTGFVLNSSFAAEILAGKLTDVVGEVEVQKRGAADWVRAKSGMMVGPGDQINTGLTGKASLVFKNSVTEIQPLTQFVVGRAFEDASAVNTELFLQVGKVISNVDPKSAKKNKFTVTTPSAVAGVRGTRQECGYSKGFGTEVKISEGAGYMAPVKAEKLPPAVQAMLGVAPAGGGRAGGVGKGEDKGTRGQGDKGKEQAQSVAQAVAEFNAWMQKSEQEIKGAGGAEGPAPVLDAATLDYVFTVADGLSATVTNTTDPTAVVDPLKALQESVAPSVLPSGSSPAEDKAAATSTEVVDAPVSVTVVEAAAATKEAVQAQTTVSATTTPTPPNRPTQGQGQGQ